MLTLDGLRLIRRARGVTATSIAALAAIEPERVKELDSRRAEPWLDEALALQRVLGLPGINDLISSSTVSLNEVETPRESDLREWRSGVRAPLSLAVRMAIRFGLDDPAHLVVPPLTLMRQIWDVMAASERHPEAPGWCTWCAADIHAGDEHLPTCLPANILSPRGPGSGPGEDERLVYTMKPARKVPKGRAVPAYGLKELRTRTTARQADIAALINVNPNHYARIERAELPLTLERAAILAAHYNVHTSVLYARPTA